MKLHLVLLISLLGSAVIGCGRSGPVTPEPQLKIATDLRGSGGAAAATTAAVSTGTGWGTIKGVFKYGGDSPTLAGLSTGGKDMEVCGQLIKNEQLVVDPASKGLANVLLFARKVSRVHPDVKDPPKTDAVFDQKQCIFLTHVFAVRTKQPILFKNSDPVGHNTAVSPPGSPAANPLLPSNGSYNYSIGRSFAVPVEATCSIHSWMKAWVIARDDPYFAVSAADGSFEIKNVPAGEKVEFQVWHERSPTGIDVKGSKGRFTVSVADGAVEDLGVITVTPATLGN